MKFKYILLSLAMTATVVCQSCDDEVEDFDAPAPISLSSVAVDGSLALKVGESKTLVPTFSPVNATSKSVKWSSSDGDVAEVSANGEVKAKKVGTATITVASVNGSKSASCTVTVSAAALVFDLNGGKGTTPAQRVVSEKTKFDLSDVSSGTGISKDTCDFLGWSNKKDGAPVKEYETGAQDTLWAIWQRNEWIDFQLPSGNLWAPFNLGTDVAEKTGYTYAWGEISTKSDFAWNGYKFADNYSLTKYNSKDALTVLDLEDDAAYNDSKKGNKWKMPTAADFQELLDNCEWQWTETFNGPRTPGYIVKKEVTVKNEKKTVEMFLPVADYWTSSLATDPFKAIGVAISSDKKGTKFEADRFIGYAIRPIKIK